MFKNVAVDFADLNVFKKLKKFFKNIILIKNFKYFKSFTYVKTKFEILMF